MSSLNDLGDQFVSLVQAHAQEIGVELKDNLNEVSQYASERAAHLSTIVGQPGWDEALVAERDNVAIYATSAAVQQADQLDQRFVNFIGQALGLLSGALALAL